MSRPHSLCFLFLFGLRPIDRKTRIMGNVFGPVTSWTTERPFKRLDALWSFESHVPTHYVFCFCLVCALLIGRHELWKMLLGQWLPEQQTPLKRLDPRWSFECHVPHSSCFLFLFGLRPTNRKTLILENAFGPVTSWTTDKPSKRLDPQWSFECHVPIHYVFCFCLACAQLIGRHENWKILLGQWLPEQQTNLLSDWIH